MTVLYSSLAIAIVSIAGAWFFSGRNRSPDRAQTRILLFGLYFWLLAFIQLIVYALAYSILSR